MACLRSESPGRGASVASRPAARCSIGALHSDRGIALIVQSLVIAAVARSAFAEVPQVVYELYGEITAYCAVKGIGYHTCGNIASEGGILVE